MTSVPIEYVKAHSTLNLSTRNASLGPFLICRHSCRHEVTLLLDTLTYVLLLLNRNYLAQQTTTKNYNLALRKHIVLHYTQWSHDAKKVTMTFLATFFPQHRILF